MFKSKFFFFVTLTLVGMTFFSSCNEESTISSDVVKVENRNIIEGQVLSNEELVKVISIMVCDPSFKNVLTNSVSSSVTSTSQAVSFMELLSGTNSSTFCQKFNQACSQINISHGLDKFISGNLANAPNLCLSLYSPDETSTSNQTLSSLPVFSEQLYDAIPNNHNYVFYSCGQLNNSLTTESAPNFNACVIQEREGFTSLLASQLNNENYFNTNSKVLYFPNFINNTNFASLNYNPLVSFNTLTLCGTNYSNPFEGRYFINDNVLTDLYNTEVNNSVNYFPPSHNHNFICDNGLVAQRTTFNNSVNAEFSNSIKLPAGNALLELNNDWCAWWNKNCRFMIDLYFPSKFNSTEYQPNQLTKFAWYNEKNLKKKNFVGPISENVFIPWFYESGNHGDEWKYNWTGKHRKEGNSFTFGLGAELGATVGFKDKLTGFTFGLTRKLSATFSTTRTNKDLPIGGSIVYWCDDILLSENRGFPYSTGDVVFHIREKQ